MLELISANNIEDPCLKKCWKGPQSLPIATLTRENEVNNMHPSIHILKNMTP